MIALGRYLRSEHALAFGGCFFFFFRGSWLLLSGKQVGLHGYVSACVRWCVQLRTAREVSR